MLKTLLRGPARLIGCGNKEDFGSSMQASTGKALQLVRQRFNKVVVNCNCRKICDLSPKKLGSLTNIRSFFFTCGL